MAGLVFPNDAGEINYALCMGHNYTSTDPFYRLCSGTLCPCLEFQIIHQLIQIFLSLCVLLIDYTYIFISLCLTLEKQEEILDPVERSHNIAHCDVMFYDLNSALMSWMWKIGFISTWVFCEVTIHIFYHYILLLYTFRENCHHYNYKCLEMINLVFSDLQGWKQSNLTCRKKRLNGWEHGSNSNKSS